MITQDILLESLKNFCTNTTGKCKNSFFENWFTKHGKTYNFIFKQNLFVTNIQFRELIDLIQLNVTKENSRTQINFMTTHEFINLTSNIIESFIDEKILEGIRNGERRVEDICSNLSVICDRYINLFENTIVIDAFYTSCIVSVPSSLEIDIQQICFQSGYIHSCGENIYTRNMRKAKYESFVKRLEEYLETSNKKLNFIMYTHEDFPIKNKIYVNDFQKHGLDEIKFYLEKFYMQNVSLMQVVEELKNNEKLKDKINIIKKIDAKNRNAEECIWMIIDRSIKDDLKYPGESKYYICYKQIYINENPFHIFDEDKPGWINSVTIPHTLMGAMLNIGRAGCINDNHENYKIKVIDPFVGSGTTLLETLKYSDLDFEGGDQCKISRIITKINLEFFALDVEILRRFQKIIFEFIDIQDSTKSSEISKDLDLNKEDCKAWHVLSVFIDTELVVKNMEEFKTKEEEFTEKFNDLTDQLTNAISWRSIERIDDNICSNTERYINIRNVNIILQICILLVWRAYRRNDFRYKNMNGLPQSFREEIVEEFKGFLYRLSSFIHLRERYKNGTIELLAKDRVIKYSGKYTRACSLNDVFIKNNINTGAEQIQENIDVLKFLEQFEGDKEKVDLIITDPPYGFNTVEEINSFSELYIKFIEAMVKTMKNGGQIIMCLPAWSYSGKTVNVFSQKEVVSRQFMIAAQKNNMYMAEKKENFAEPTQLYTFPFYWDSEKALRRDIVKFQFFIKE